MAWHPGGRHVHPITPEEKTWERHWAVSLLVTKLTMGLHPKGLLFTWVKFHAFIHELANKPKHRIQNTEIV